MTHHLRYRGGQVQYVRVPVDAATVLTPGDLVWLDTDDAKPASDFPWDTNLATTQQNFADKFLGVVQNYSAPGETGDVTVDVSPMSIYEFEVPSGTYTMGADLGPDEGSSDLLNARLESVASADSSIARVMELRGTATTRVRVSFASSIHVVRG